MNFEHSYLFDLGYNDEDIQCITRDDLLPLKQQQMRYSLGLPLKSLQQGNDAYNYKINVEKREGVVVYNTDLFTIKKPIVCKNIAFVFSVAYVVLCFVCIIFL